MEINWTKSKNKTFYSKIKYSPSSSSKNLQSIRDFIYDPLPLHKFRLIKKPSGEFGRVVPQRESIFIII